MSFTLAESALNYSLDELFEQHAIQNGDSLAVICGDRQVSYRDLRNLVNLVAAHLEQLNVERDSFVGVYLNPSVEALVAILAVWRVGMAYVPLDLTYPQERLHQVLEDAASKVVLTDSKLALRLPASTTLLLLDGGLAEVSCNRTRAKPHLDDLAYVTYTSSSTGPPKGAMITHRALSNHTLWMQTAFPLSPEDRVLCETSVTCDASVWEICTALV